MNNKTLFLVRYRVLTTFYRSASRFCMKQQERNIRDADKFRYWGKVFLYFMRKYIDVLEQFDRQRGAL